MSRIKRRNQKSTHDLELFKKLLPEVIPEVWQRPEIRKFFQTPDYTYLQYEYSLRISHSSIQIEKALSSTEDLKQWEKALQRKGYRLLADPRIQFLLRSWQSHIGLANILKRQSDSSFSANNPVWQLQKRSYIKLGERCKERLAIIPKALIDRAQRGPYKKLLIKNEVKEMYNSTFKDIKKSFGNAKVEADKYHALIAYIEKKNLVRILQSFLKPKYEEKMSVNQVADLLLHKRLDNKHNPQSPSSIAAKITAAIFKISIPTLKRRMSSH